MFVLGQPAGGHLSRAGLLHEVFTRESLQRGLLWQLVDGARLTPRAERVELLKPPGGQHLCGMGVGGRQRFTWHHQCLLSAAEFSVVSEVAVRSANPAPFTPVHAWSCHSSLHDFGPPSRPGGTIVYGLVSD